MLVRHLGPLPWIFITADYRHPTVLFSKKCLS